MTEFVTITPEGGYDHLNDPLPDGAPFDLIALDVAPGNTLQRFGVGGDLDSVEFTVFLPLRTRMKVGGNWVWQSVMEKLTASFTIEVRDRSCVGRAQEWDTGGVGGVAVLCHSATGASSQ